MWANESDRDLILFDLIYQIRWPTWRFSQKSMRTVL